MIANLPLLFANGNPVALTKITASELEKFITFMVTCSWGHDTAKDIRQPPWWPSDVEFSHPFRRPDVVPSDWEARLKNLVKKCYDFHKSAFLLVFSAQLARYPRNRLRYVDNRDHTTSLYFRPSGRLLVTFRNENLNYDHNSEPIYVEEDTPAKPADIYLCDNCDSHFDNIDVLRAHERLCNNEEVPQSMCSGGLPEFLSALKLLPAGDKVDNIKSEIEVKTRNTRTAASIDRGPAFPFSSLAYLKNAKANVERDYTYSRERIERYCCTSTPISKVIASKSKGQFPVKYRRPIDYWYRKHVFPDQRNKKLLDLNGQLLLFKCRPITVDVQRMSMETMQEYIDKLRKDAEKRESEDIIFVDCEPVEDETKGDPLKRSEDCEVIDLCSDDESSSVNENCDPRAGVACVMRGGAILRRNAVTPSSQPAEPCGARQRPLQAAVLQPHPVILITHSLNNLQTISLE